MPQCIGMNDIYILNTGRILIGWESACITISLHDSGQTYLAGATTIAYFPKCFRFDLKFTSKTQRMYGI